MIPDYEQFVVDTHAFIWFLGDDPKFGSNASRILQTFHGKLVLPAIALAEACWIVGAGKSNLKVETILTALDQDNRFYIYPMNREVVEKCNALTTIREMHDRQIVASTMLLIERGTQTALLTIDRNITESALVPVVW